jgi:hypothetical protein
MLQYLTDDLLPGFGLPKKRVTVGVWSLRDSVVSYDGRSLGSGYQYTDVMAIGDMIEDGFVYGLHTDSRINIITTDIYHRLKWEDLHRYLE